MVIKIKKSILYEWVIPILLIIPYLDRGWVRNTFLYNKNGVYIYPIMYMMIVVGIFFTFITRKNRIYFYKMNSIIKLLYIFATLFFLYGLMIGMKNDKVAVFIVQFLWLFLPIWYSWKVYLFFNYYNLNIGKIIDNYITIFVLYCLFSIVIQIYYYGFGFGTSVRLGGGSGSGGLLFSYTVTIVFGLLILRKDNISFAFRNVMAAILILFTILSGSRGAIIFILIEIIIYIFTNKGIIESIVIGSIVFVYMLVGEPIKYIYAIAPRLMNLTDNMRTQTIRSALKVVIEQDVITNLFGNGLGQFFPYQNWLSSTNSLFGTVYFKNYVEVKGNVFLVQPHNTYVHLLLEVGVIGLVIFCSILICFIRILINKQNCSRIKCLLFVLICAYNFLDSVFSMAPGIASIWWIIVLIIVRYEEEEKYEKSNASLRYTSRNNQDVSISK